LNHPHIAMLHEVGEHQGSRYLVMEFVEGEPLKGPLRVKQAVAYALQILDALEAAHLKGIVHRDLKPANILVTKSEAKSVVKLLDFGLAKQTLIAPGPEEDTQSLSRAGPSAVMGTPDFMAPEQWEGKRADARSDIYAFGCVMHMMLTGKRAGADRRAVRPAALETVLRKCLERDRAERWQSVAEIRPQPQRALSSPRKLYWIAAAAVLALLTAATWWLRFPRVAR
jgi:eukaryotic-like serine/threonine-protein kinase